MVDGATSSGQICKPVSQTTLEPAMIEGSRKVDGAASSGQICKPVSPTTLEPAMIEGSRRVMESGPAMESSLVFPPMRSKDPMESSHMLEKMESSFPAGFPIRVDFSKSMESSFEAWKQSGHNKQLSMESSPIMYVKGVKGLDGTRSLKMYRNKSRKRSSVWSRNMESSPTESSSECSSVCSSQATSNWDSCSSLVVGAVEGVAALHQDVLESDSSL